MRPINSYWFPRGGRTVVNSMTCAIFVGTILLLLVTTANAQGSNLVVNGSLDTNTDGWVELIQGSLSHTTDMPHSPPGAGLLTIGNEAVARAEQCIDISSLEPGTELNVSAWGKRGESNVIDFSLAIYFSNDSNCPYNPSKTIHFQSGTSDWVQVSTVATIPSEVSYIGVVIQSQEFVNLPATVMFDDVEIIPVDAPTAVSLQEVNTYSVADIPIIPLLALALGVAGILLVWRREYRR